MVQAQRTTQAGSALRSRITAQHSDRGLRLAVQHAPPDQAGQPLVALRSWTTDARPRKLARRKRIRGSCANEWMGWYRFPQYHTVLHMAHFFISLSCLPQWAQLSLSAMVLVHVSVFLVHFMPVDNLNMMSNGIRLLRQAPRIDFCHLKRTCQLKISRLLST